MERKMKCNFSTLGLQKKKYTLVKLLTAISSLQKNQLSKFQIIQSENPG